MGYFIGKYEMTKIAVTDFNISYIIELFFRHQGLKRELFVDTKDWKENCFVDTKDWKESGIYMEFEKAIV